ncbi:MAG: hypothetical protein ABI612_24180, partial [Betaproteobacteria bacterium]
ADAFVGGFRLWEPQHHNRVGSLRNGSAAGDESTWHDSATMKRCCDLSLFRSAVLDALLRVDCGNGRVGQEGCDDPGDRGQQRVV